MATALVTGGNRGLGLECARQLAVLGHRVFLAARNFGSAEEAAAGLLGNVIPLQLDVTRSESVAEAARALMDQIESLEILINNAGVYPAGDSNPVTVDQDAVAEALLTNVVGPQWVTQALVPLLASARPNACVVNVSSGLGSFDLCAGPHAEFKSYIGTAYGSSKAALNMLTVAWARHFESVGSPIRVNAVSPGWCRTAMGSEEAPRSAEEGAAALLRFAFLSADGPSGQFFGADGQMPW